MLLISWNNPAELDLDCRGFGHGFLVEAVVVSTKYLKSVKMKTKNQKKPDQIISSISYKRSLGEELEAELG